MHRILLALTVAGLSSIAIAESRWQLPDIPGFHTLHCDFHTHTILSDGEVWPTVRITEARKEGLDCIAITDHLKYGKGSKQAEVEAGRNRGYEIALQAAAGSDLIVVRGAELTQGMPPGHINAVLLSDNEIAHMSWRKTIERARDNGAFLFWNHPGWKSPDKLFQQDGIAQWYDEHDQLLSADRLHGIEIVNGRTYSREAHQWAIERGLTIFGNSDVHETIAFEHDLKKEHRPMTLVIATERSVDGIREALFERRTLVWFENSLIGDADLLEPLFKTCVTADPAAYMENLAVTHLRNACPVDFVVELTDAPDLYNTTRVFELAGNEKKGVAIKTGKRLAEIALSLRILNLLTTPDESLQVTFDIDVSDKIVDKTMLEVSGAK